MNRFIRKRKRQKAIVKGKNFAIYNMESGAMARDETQTMIMKIIRIEETRNFEG